MAVIEAIVVGKRILVLESTNVLGHSGENHMIDAPGFCARRCSFVDLELLQNDVGSAAALMRREKKVLTECQALVPDDMHAFLPRTHDSQPERETATVHWYTGSVQL
jgi:hypothetical protein